MKYNAFISYRHTHPDLEVAKTLHKKLETFRVPYKVRKETGIKRIDRVFRDQEELPIGSDLGDNIREALRESEFLIVICSPRTPQSDWVQREIATFIELHDREHVLAILIEGEPQASFPAALLTDENGNPVEPLAADIRDSSMGGMKRKFKTELLRLAAPLLHCAYDDLRQRHRERKMRRAMAIVTGVAALMAGFAVYSGYTAMQISENYRQKQINQSKYLADTALALNEEGDRMDAILLALEALPGEANDRPYVAQAEAALNTVMHTYEDGTTDSPDRMLTLDLPASDIDMNEEGDRLIAIDQGDNVYLFNVSDGTLLLRYSTPVDEEALAEDLVSASILADGNVIVGLEHGIYSIDLNGSTVWEAPAEGAYDYLREMKYDEKSDTAVCIYGDYVQVLRGADGSKVCRVNISDYTREILEGVWEVPEEVPVAADTSAPEVFFRGYAEFSEDGSAVAIPIYVNAGDDEEKDIGTVLVMDTATGKGRIYHCAYEYISDLVLTGDCLVVGSDADADLDNMLDGGGLIERIDLADGSVRWQHPYTFEVYTFDSTGLKLYTRSFTDASGAQVDSVIYCQDNQLGALDTDTGEVKSQFTVSSAVTEVARSMTSGLIMAIEGNGTVDYFDAETGKEYRDNARNLGFEINQLRARGGVMVIRQTSSPNIILLKGHPGEGYRELVELPETIRTVKSSESANTYIVQCYSEDALHIFDRDTLEEIFTYTTDQRIYEFDVMDNGNPVVFEADGLMRIDPQTGSENLISPAGVNLSTVKFSAGSKRAVSYGYGGLAVYSYEGETTQVIWESDESYPSMAALSDDGRTLTYLSRDNELYLVDLESGSSRIVQEETLKALMGVLMTNGLALNYDGSMLALSCMDGNVRIYDVAQEAVVARIPIIGRSRIYLAFSPDGGQLLMQGDDYYFKVYDLASGQMMLSAAEQYEQITGIAFSQEAQKVVLYTYGPAIILNADTYEVTAKAESAELVDFAADAVLTADYDRLIYFPYLSLDELMQLAKQEVGDAVLSEEKRLQLHVD